MCFAIVQDVEIQPHQGCCYIFSSYNMALELEGWLWCPNQRCSTITAGSPKPPARLLLIQTTPVSNYNVVSNCQHTPNTSLVHTMCSTLLSDLFTPATSIIGLSDSNVSCPVLDQLNFLKMTAIASLARQYPGI